MRSLKYFYCLFALPLVLANLLAADVYADEATDENVKLEVEEILVTANRTEQSISDVS